MKVLIVDDSRGMRMIVLRTLRQAGFTSHEFVEASNGKEALEKLREGGFGLVLSDWNMPEMTGIDLLNQLRADGNSVAFGFITSESSEKMRDLATSAGARFLITKPFTPASFEAALASILG